MTSFTLHHDPFGRLVLTDSAGGQHVDVAPVRGFPLSDPDRGVSILDAEGQELVWIEKIADLPEAVRRLLEEDLARREFVPVVKRVCHVSVNTEPNEWEVETDRGRTRFVLNHEDQVHRLDAQRAMIVDSHGIRYIVPDIKSLDPTSRRYLERYL